MRLVLLLGLLVSLTPVCADELPSMRPGMWEFIRKAPPDPINHPGQLSTLAKKECVKSMREVFLKQQGTLAKSCKFSETRKAGNSYTTTGACDMPQAQARFASKNVTTVKGDNAYESRIDTDGTAAGRPVKWTEYLVAKWIGECAK